MARASRSPLRFQFTALGARTVRLGITDPAVVASLDVAVSDHAEEVMEKVRIYPPPPTNSKYERTFTLASSWRISRFTSGDSFGYRVTNNATDPRGRQYAHYVHGPGVQPQGFQSNVMPPIGWRNIDDFVNRTDLRTALQDIVTVALRFR